MEDDKNIKTNSEKTGENNSNPTSFSIDYDRIAKIVEGKQSVTEDSVLKGYFKQQGLSEDEMKQAISRYKEDKAARTPDISSLNQKLAEANERATKAEVQMQAMTMSGELGVPVVKMPYLIKMADMSDVVKDGQVDQEKLKESLNAVLKDVPELKSTIDNGAHGGFKIGTDKDDTGMNQNEELARIFGVKMK